MFSELFHLLCFWILIDLCVLIEIDNSLVGEPQVECGENEIVFRVSTENPFSGRIYVKGESSDPTCVRNYLTRETSTAATMIALNQCNIRRLRIPGQSIEYVTTIVVSFHPTFVTKIDRAYRVHCYFRQFSNSFTFPLDVSMIQTTEVLTQTSAPISCTYHIVRGDPSGPPIRFAVIGEPVYHVWQCDTDTMRILVRSCIVNDGNGRAVQVIDENGCSNDKYILPTPEYEGPIYNMAFAESHVFKFADIPSLVFQCQIRLCSPQDEDCLNLTPPDCAEPSGFVSPVSNGPDFISEQLTTDQSIPQAGPAADRNRTLIILAENATIIEAERFRRSLYGDYNWDILSNQFTVFDLPDIDDDEPLKDFSQNENNLDHNLILESKQTRLQPNLVCVATHSLVAIMACFVTLLIIIVGLGVTFVLRSKKERNANSRSNIWTSYFCV